MEQINEEYGEVGRYMAFDKLVIAEGGLTNALALERATNYAEKCCELGAPIRDLERSEEVFRVALL